MVGVEAACVALLVMTGVMTTVGATNKERLDFSSDHDEDSFGFSFPFESAREFVEDLDSKIKRVDNFPGDDFKNYDAVSGPDEQDSLGRLPVEAHYPHPPNFGSKAARSRTSSDPNSHSSGYQDAAEPFFHEADKAVKPRGFEDEVFTSNYPNTPEQSDISFLPPLHSVRFKAPKPDKIIYSPSTKQVNVSYKPQIHQEINYSDNGDIEIIQKIPLHRKFSRTATPSVKPVRSTLVKHATSKPTVSSFHEPLESFLASEPSVKPIESFLHKDVSVKPVKSSPVFKRDSIEPFDDSYHGQPSVKPITSSIQKPGSFIDTTEGLHNPQGRKEEKPYQPPVYIPRPDKADPYKLGEHDTAYKQPPVDYVVAKPTPSYKHSFKPAHEPIHETYEPIHDPYKPSKPVHKPYKPPHKPVLEPYVPPHKPIREPYKPPHKPFQDSYEPFPHPQQGSYKPPPKPVHDSYKPQHKPIYEKNKVIKPLEPVYKPVNNKPKQVHNSYKPLHDPYKPLDEHFLHEEAPYKKSSIPGKPGSDYPVYSEVPHTSFSCSKVPYRPGMYANVEAHCQVYHVCHDDRYGDQGAAFLCTNGTLFNQATFNCDWWYNVDCGKAMQYYDLNLDPNHNPYYQKPYEGPLHVPSYDAHSDPHQQPSYRSDDQRSSPSFYEPPKPSKSFDEPPHKRPYRSHDHRSSPSTSESLKPFRSLDGHIHKPSSRPDDHRSSPKPFKSFDETHRKLSHRSDDHKPLPSPYEPFKPFSSFDGSPENKTPPPTPSFPDPPKPSHRQGARQKPSPSFQESSPQTFQSSGASSFQSSRFKFT